VTEAVHIVEPMPGRDITPLPFLPALRHLGELADRRPVVVCDSREQEPLPIARLPVIRAGLATGDYSFQGGEHLLSIERKSLDDLAACCGPERDRFTRELERMRGFDFARLLVIGTEADVRAGRYRSRIEPRAVLHSLWAFEARFRLQVVFADTPEAGAALVERWVWIYAREMVQRTNALFRGADGPS
jgi:DNA excision repair protein ERCC-4